MGEFQDCIAAGFVVMKAAAGTNITCGAVTKVCVATPAMTTRELDENGLMPGVDMLADVSRTDFTALGIVLRSTVTIDSRILIVLMIESDDQDPVVRLHLKHKLV